MWGGRGGAPGRFECPLDLLIIGDEVYVADSGNERIQCFSLSGELLRILDRHTLSPDYNFILR